MQYASVDSNLLAKTVGIVAHKFVTQGAAHNVATRVQENVQLAMSLSWLC